MDFDLYKYYSHPDCEVQEKFGWGHDICASPFTWVYHEHGKREEILMDRRQMISTVLGILAAMITICVVAYFLYENSQTSWQTIEANCAAVIDSAQHEVVISETCDYYDN